MIKYMQTLKGGLHMEVSELFRANKRESAVDIVVNNIKQLLVERKLKPGDRLPNELEISEGLGVSRGSVREAMKILSAFGLVDIRVGNGTYVCESPGNTMMDSLLFSFFVANPNSENLYELRHIIEIDVLELILKHYEQNLEERILLKKNLDNLEEMLKNTPTSADLKENDLSFHRLLGACTKNILMERIYNIVIDFMEPSIANTHRKQQGEIVFNVHKKIVNVIEQRDYSRIHETITDSTNTWSSLQDT